MAGLMVDQSTAAASRTALRNSLSRSGSVICSSKMPPLT